MNSTLTFFQSWLANYYRHFLSTFLVIGFVIKKNKWQRCLNHIGKTHRSIYVSTSLYLSQYFYVKLEYWLKKLLESFLWNIVFLCNNILLLQRNSANLLVDMFKVSTCSGYVSLMIRFACVLNHHLLIHFPSLLVSINPLYNSFWIIGNITSLFCVDHEVGFFLH